MAKYCEYDDHGDMDISNSSADLMYTDMLQLITRTILQIRPEMLAPEQKQWLKCQLHAVVDKILV